MNRKVYGCYEFYMSAYLSSAFFFAGIRIADIQPFTVTFHLYQVMVICSLVTLLRTVCCTEIHFTPCSRYFVPYDKQQSNLGGYFAL